MEYCCFCGGVASERHHKIFRSQARALIKCKLNICPLCKKCHSKLHSSKGHEMDLHLKQEFQNELEMLFIKQYLTISEIMELLEINEHSARTLTKTLKLYKEGYKREDLIKACLGGRFYVYES